MLFNEGAYMNLRIRKKIMILSIVFIFLGTYFVSIPSSEIERTSIMGPSSKHDEINAWTSLFYINVESNDPLWTILINPDILHDHFMYRKQLKSGENHQILVLQDRRRSPAVIYSMDENSDRTVLKEIGEVNTGDPETLIEFINYGKEQYPAERYHLAFWSHSNAWVAVCADASSNHDSLTPDELQYALTETEGVDLLSFIGCCLMGSLEVAYEVRDCCEVYVASESMGNQNDWYGMIDDLCDMLNTNTTMSTIEIGRQIVNLICCNSNEFRDTMTISAIQTDTLSSLVQNIDALSKYLIEQDDVIFTTFLSARNQTKDFPIFDSRNLFRRYRQGISYLIDIYDFITHYQEIETDQTIQYMLNSMKTNITNAIIAECHGTNQTGSHGLSLFYSSNDMLSTYAEYDLDFTTDTHWDDLLEKHKEKTRSIRKIDTLPLMNLKRYFLIQNYLFDISI